MKQVTQSKVMFLLKVYQRLQDYFNQCNSTDFTMDSLAKAKDKGNALIQKRGYVTYDIEEVYL